MSKQFVRVFLPIRNFGLELHRPLGVFSGATRVGMTVGPRIGGKATVTNGLTVIGTGRILNGSGMRVTESHRCIEILRGDLVIKR